MLVVVRFFSLLVALHPASSAPSDGPTVSFHPSIYANEAEPHVKSDEGHVALVWAPADDSSVLWYELQCAEDPSFAGFETRYEGHGTRSFLSGFPDGEYFFRVRARRDEHAPWGPWSPTFHMHCSHHPIRAAWILFSIGGVLFLGIVAFVVTHAYNLDRYADSS